MSKHVLIALIAILFSAAPVLAEDLSPSGTVTTVTGPEVLREGEKLTGQIAFAKITKAHDVVIRWVDTKGRICEQLARTIAPPRTSLGYRLQVARPIGYNHRVEVLIDGQVQPASHRFTVQYPYTPWIDYYSIVWAHYERGQADLVRQAGFNGQITSANAFDGTYPAGGQGHHVTDSDLFQYPDNIGYRTFAYYQKRQDEYRAMVRTWFKFPNYPVLAHRRPSLTDEGTWEQFADYLLPVVAKVKRYRPVFYNMADELGVAVQSSVSDLDWAYSSRDAWREWLKAKYVSVATLNRQWESDYATWDHVRTFFPSTNYMYDQLWEQNLLPKSFGTIEKFNQAFGTSYGSFKAVVAGYRNIRSDDEGMTAKGLAQRYGNPKWLANALGSGFEDYEAAEAYLKAFEKWVKAQRADDTRGWNLSWWCDFREYMDDYMATALARARDMGHKADPGGRFGITGTHHPGVFNGHNYAKLVKSVDTIIPYNIGHSFELMRGLDPDFPYMHPTWAQGKGLQRDLWWHFIHGCRGVLLWDAHNPKHRIIDRKSRTLTARGRAGAATLKEITSGTDRMLLGSRRTHGGVAIYHSQPSIRVNWWHQWVGVGRRYILRSSSNEFKQDRRNGLRKSWLKLIEDSYLQSLFITGEQMAEGRHKAEGVRVIVLPEAWALSDEEARNITAFVEAGGTVIADQYTGLYDAHGRRREAGVLDGLFGIDQSAVAGDVRSRGGKDSLPKRKPLKPLPGGEMLSADAKAAITWDDLATRGPNARGVRVVANDATFGVGDANDAAFVIRKVGRGKAVFLNLNLAGYANVRGFQPAKGQIIAALLRSVLPKDVQPTATVSDGETRRPKVGAEVVTWQAGPGRKHLTISSNYIMRKRGTGGEDAVDNSYFEKEGPVVIKLDRRYHVVNQRTGEAYGRTDEVSLIMGAWEPTILTLQDVPFDKPTVSGPASAKRGELLKLAITGQTKLTGDLQVFHVEAVNPDGKSIWYYSKDLSGRTGSFSYEIPLALNDWLGEWTFNVREVATRAVVTHKVTVTD